VAQSAPQDFGFRQSLRSIGAAVFLAAFEIRKLIAKQWAAPVEGARPRAP